MSEETGLGIDRLRVDALAEIATAKDLSALDQVRVRYLGKSGLLTAELLAFATRTTEDRSVAVRGRLGQFHTVMTSLPRTSPSSSCRMACGALASS